MLKPFWVCAVNEKIVETNKERQAITTPIFHAGLGWVTGSESQFRKLFINLKNFSNQTRTKHSCRRYQQVVKRLQYQTN